MTFDSWMAANCSPPENYSLAQYSRYLEGWRQSMPWAYKGMSLAYDAWAESRWEEIADKDRLITAWKDGQAVRAKSLGKWASTEEAADFMLEVFV